MADTLKFGPQWLRALSDGNSVTSPPPSPGFVAKYKLAEHRYGREEMLALYLQNTKMPDIMKEFPSIASEKILQPMAFLTQTDDEQRLMAQGVNSTAVLRLFGRGGGPPVRGMGRGVVERGRGRGRGRGEPPAGFYTRGASFEEEGFGRGRAGRGAVEWEEGDGRRLERSFSGRPSFEDTATSPRREFSRSMSSDNWREAKKGGGGGGGGGGAEGEEDGDGDWRRAGPRDKFPPTGSRASWREAREREHDNYEQRGGHHHHRELPEWSVDADDIEENFIGTFDASGAFVSLKDARDDPRFRDGARQKGQGDLVESGHDEIKTRQNPNQNEGEEPENWDEEDEPPEDMRPKITPGKQASHQERVVNDGQRPVGKSKSMEKPQNQNLDRHAQSQNQERFSGPSRSAEGVRKETGLRLMINEKVPNMDSNQGSNSLSTSDINMNKKNIRKEDDHQRNSPRSPEIADERVRVNASPHSNAVEQQQQHQQQQRQVPQHPHQHPQQQRSQQRSQQHQQPVAPQEADFGHLEKAAVDLVDQWEAEEDSRLNNKMKVEHADSWFYRDPQGDLQGPFSAQDMTEWFTAGYFTMNLLVKRGCDEIFHPLGELIKRWGRVPFIPGPQPPPLTASQVESPVTTSVGMSSAGAPNIPIQAPMASGAVPITIPNIPNVPPEQLKQQLLLQQHLYMRQMQMQALTPQQQQSMLLSLLMQQQQVASMMKANQAPSPPPQQMPRPASGEGVATSQAAFQNPLNDPAIQSYQRSLSQPPTMEQAWPPNNPPMTAAPGWPGAANVQGPGPSVWDMEPAKNSSSPSMEEIQRAEVEKQAREVAAAREAAVRDAAAREAAARDAVARDAVARDAVARDAAAREAAAAAREVAAREAAREAERARKEEEHRRRLEEEEEKRRKVAEEEERRRQADMERQRLEQLRREQEELRRRQIEEEKRQREEEERNRREEEERKRREEEERRRREEEERSRRELEEKRLEEIVRRQKAEEIRRQQEAVRRIQQQEQLQNIQLPSTAQWGSGATGNTSSSAPSLEEIQKMEAEKLKEQQQEEQRRLELQRQQMAALQRQQQQSTTWAAQARSAAQPSPLSLRKIQQEQALQLDANRQRAAPQPKPNNVPLATAAAWGSGGAPSGGNWAADSAWGRPAPSAGFWEDPAPAPVPAPAKPSKKQSAPGQTNTTKKPKAEANTNKTKAAKTKKEEETIQRLFQSAKPKDDFTQWCEDALCDIESSVDVPTFIAFLQDVESPYEIHDYVRNYLGDTKDSEEFATQFLERRSKFKNKIKQQQKPEEPIWGPAPAINPILKQQQLLQQQLRDEDEAGHKRKSKKKMQKVDNNLLGFTVLAAPDRINIGEIDSIET